MVDGAAQEGRPIKRTGDQITLKSGKVLHGVKIVRQTSVNLVLEVIPGVEPLIIPAKQVASIKYGALGPRYDQPEALPGSSDRERIDVVPAVKTSPALIRQLALPFTDESIIFSNQDILNVLRSVSILSGVSIAIDPKLESMTPEVRKVTLDLPPGTSMEKFLKKILPDYAPWLAVRFDYNALHIGYRELEDEAPEQRAAGQEKTPGGLATGQRRP